MFVRWQIVRAGHVLLLKVVLVCCCFFVESFCEVSPGVLSQLCGDVVFVEDLSYVVIEGVGDKRNFEREECVVSVGFLF